MNEASKAKADAKQASGNVEVLVPSHIAERAHKAWDVAIAAYFGTKDSPGIERLSRELEGLRAKAPTEVLDLGRLCLTHCGGDHKRAGEVFYGACASAERRALNVAKGKGMENPTVRELNPSWIVAKSNVGKALEKGMALNHEIVTKHGDKEERRLPGYKDVTKFVRDSRGAQQPKVRNIETTASCRAALDGLLKALATAPTEVQDEAAGLLVLVTTRVQELVKATVIEPAKTEAAAKPAKPAKAKGAKAEPAPSIAAQIVGSEAKAAAAEAQQRRMRGGSR